MNQQLTNFYDHLNTSVITTNDFAEGTLFRKREKVNQFAYCGLNPVYRKYLIRNIAPWDADDLDADRSRGLRLDPERPLIKVLLMAASGR
ncbi:MAG: hypothetical protein ACOYB1_01360 [Limnohabitans sp.]